MTRRLPQQYASSRNKTFPVDYSEQGSMSLAAQHAYLPSGGLGCTTAAHGPGCSCAMVRAMLDHGHSTPDMPFGSGNGQHFVTSAGEATSGWFPPCHPLQGYSSYHYGSLGSTDIPSSSSVAFANAAPQQAFSNPGSHCRSHQHQQPQQQQQPPPPPHSILDSQHFRSSLPMSELNVSAPSHNAPALQSPSSGNSSEGTSSPQTPPASVATPLKQEYGPHSSPRDDGHHIGFPRFESVQTLLCNGEEVTPHIDANIERNIFFKESRWTCYRRNYLFVQCSYNLTPCVPGAPMYVDTAEGKKMVQALGVKLSAVMDGDKGKDVGLVQQTPKRDRGPQYPVKVEKLEPSQVGETPLVYTKAGSSAVSPYLPLQSEDGNKAAGMSPVGVHTFERIQFKQATANNGRRRAAQQFYYLLVELHADVRKSVEQDEKWLKVAHRISEPMVVRGRSPGHYKDSTAPSGASSGGGGGSFGPPGFGYGGGSSGSGGAGAGAGGPSIPYGIPSSSQSRGPVGSSGSGGGAYFQAQPHHHHHHHHLPSTPGWTAENSTPLKSPASVESKSDNGGMTEQEAFAFDNDEGYRYYGSAAWPASLAVSHRANGKADNNGGAESASLAASDNATWASYAPICSRFEGMPSSQGYYQDMKAAF